MKNKNVEKFFILSIAVVLASLIFSISAKAQPNPTDKSVCGGVAGFECQTGYECVLNNPQIYDSLGKCVQSKCLVDWGKAENIFSCPKIDAKYRNYGNVMFEIYNKKNTKYGFKVSLNVFDALGKASSPGYSTTLSIGLASSVKKTPWISLAPGKYKAVVNYIPLENQADAKQVIIDFVVREKKSDSVRFEIPVYTPKPTTTPSPPKACTLQYDPVCGVDGKTYGNKCQAEISGIAIAYLGACNKPVLCGGFVGKQCPTGYTCVIKRGDFGNCVPIRKY